MLESGDERKMTIAEIIEENAELKRMLKIAVEDIYNRSYCGMCENGIPIDNDVCDRCKAITLDMFEWRHKAEVNNKITFSSSYFCFNILPKQIIMEKLEVE